MKSDYTQPRVATPANPKSIEGRLNMENRLRFGTSVLQLRSKATALFAATLLALGTVAPAWATIDNTVTVTGSSPSGTDDVTDTASETVDVEDTSATIAVTKTADDTTDVAAGQVVTYTYTVENTGNVTLTAISLADAHEGAINPTPGSETLTDNGTLGDSTDAGVDGTWDTLAPGDLVTWTATYTVTQSDITSNGIDDDNDLENTVTATASSPGNTDDVTNTATEIIDLEDVNASLDVAKVADDDTDVVVGQVITYTYTITNDGNVPITGISLSDNVTAGSGATPTPDADGGTLTDNAPLADSTNPTLGDSEWDTLGPGDVLVVTATYTVTQSDVDNLQ